MKLKEYVKFSNGKKKPIEKGNVPIYGGNGILGYTNRYNAESNNIIVGRVGAYCGCVYKCDSKCWISDNAILGKVKENVDYNYIYYLLNYLDLNKLHIGAAQPLMTQDILNDIEVCIPNYSTQRKISKILLNIDKKIELNNEINNNLLEISKQLYKRWFVDYEFPNENGNPYKSSGGEMIESEIGSIPKNWTVKTLEDISINFDSKRKPLSNRERENRKGDIPYYGATSIIGYVDDYIFDDKYVLMGEDGSVINSDNTPVLQYIWRKCWVNNHAHILQGKEISTEHLLECLRSTDVSPIITGAVQLKINQANMNTLKYAIPTKEINDIFEKVLEKIYDNYRNNTEENERLEQLRDTLLPKLMNGEIDLDNIDI